MLTNRVDLANRHVIFQQVRRSDNRLTCGFSGAPGAIRTRDTRFRRAVLCPLSYEGP